MFSAANRALTADGVFLCSRYAYPPNSLSLCGPDKHQELKHYSVTAAIDRGSTGILQNFSTLYPYLCLIAYKNNIHDPFDPAVIEAYWLGNRLLEKVKPAEFADLLKDKFMLKKMKPKEMSRVFYFFPKRPFPNHSFHVLALWRRTGHLDIPHTLETMDACLINWGKILGFDGNQSIKIETQKLEFLKGNMCFKKKIIRTIDFQGKDDILKDNLRKGDYISYHWGYFCQKLSLRQLNNLKYFTRYSLNVINT